jgi:hypothetical protein
MVANTPAIAETDHQIRTNIAGPCDTVLSLDATKYPSEATANPEIGLLKTRDA